MATLSGESQFAARNHLQASHISLLTIAGNVVDGGTGFCRITKPLTTYSSLKGRSRSSHSAKDSIGLILKDSNLIATKTCENAGRSRRF